MRKAWRIPGNANKLVVIRSDLKKDETPIKPHFFLSNINQLVANPFFRNDILDMYRTTGGNAGRGGGTVSDRELHKYVKPHIERAIQRGDLVLVQIPVRAIIGVGEIQEPQLKREDDTRPVKEKTWIRFQAVEEKTGRPVAGLKLKITLPNGSDVTYSTKPDGVIEIQNIPQGVCNIASGKEFVRITKTLVCIDIGRGETTPVTTGDDSKPLEALDGSDMCIAIVESHRVKTDEMLKSIAEKNGMRWQQLTEFNWGTSKPSEVNNFLRDSVGCTKKTADGRNYMFDNSDDPGIIFISKKWQRIGLPTDRTHVIYVKQKRIFNLILENEEQRRIPEAQYEVTLSDGTKRKGRLGKSGVGLIEDPPPGVVEVEYLDHDDIEAKSLAACVRKAFDKRETDEIFRLLGHSPKMIKMVISAYDRYYNDYTGKGLIEDIYHEITYPAALEVVEGGLSKAGITTHGDVQYVNDEE